MIIDRECSMFMVRVDVVKEFEENIDKELERAISPPVKKVREPTPHLLHPTTSSLAARYVSPANQKVDDRTSKWNNPTRKETPKKNDNWHSNKSGKHLCL